MRTYSRLRPYVQHGHKDPSVHVIISHAITEKMIYEKPTTRVVELQHRTMILAGSVNANGTLNDLDDYEKEDDPFNF